MSTISADWSVQIEQTKKNHNVFCGLGIHPWYANALSFEYLSELESLLKLSSVVALGDIGLDFPPPIKKIERYKLTFLVSNWN